MMKYILQFSKKWWCSKFSEAFLRKYGRFVSNQPLFPDKVPDTTGSGFISLNSDYDLNIVKRVIAEDYGVILPLVTQKL